MSKSNKKFMIRKENSKDKKQDKRIRSLEKMVYKTIENKQINSGAGSTVPDLPRNLTSAGDVRGQFLSIATGAEDGNVPGDPARVGNSVTLMEQLVSMTFVQSTTDTYNRCRVIIAESVDGNQPLALSDILQYSNYGVYGDMVFSSPYTTKADTNRRYDIKMDTTFELNANAKGATKIIKERVKYREDGSPGKVLDFSSGLDVYSSNHRLSILCISDSASTPHPTWYYNVRSTYKDA
jgi:hypothetical protein